MDLSPDEVHVWWADPAQLDDERLAAAARALLADDEIARLQRFQVEHARRLYLATRVLARRALSCYARTAPDAWRFSTNRYGRPEIADRRSPLRFNLSNTDGLVVCAIARAAEVGIDSERLHPDPPLGVAERYFGLAERAALRDADAAQRARRFFDYWTLKESYTKARGLGLALPLDRFCFTLGRDRAPRIEIDPALGDDGAWWQFEQAQPGPDHLISVCVRRRRPESDYTVRWRPLPLTPVADGSDQASPLFSLSR